MTYHIADIINIPLQFANIFRVKLIDNQLSETSRKSIYGVILILWLILFSVAMVTVKLKSGNSLCTRLHNMP